jgi:hypothetical protein
LLIVAGALACGDSTSPPAFGPPATLTKIDGDETTADAGTAVTPRPRVLVTDDEDRPVPDVEVTFTVVTGGGSLTGATVETDEDGIASVGSWTLGSLGENVIRASSGELDAVTFTSTAQCRVSGTLALDAEIEGSLSLTDCRYPQGWLTDRYTLTLATPAAVRFTQSSDVFDSYFELVRDGETVVAFHDDIDREAGNFNSSVRVLLPAGTYELSPSSARANEQGPYVVGAATATTDMVNCDFMFVVPGVTAQQQLDPSDCPEESFFSELFIIRLEAGRSYTITMTSTAFKAYLLLFRQGPQGLLFASEDDNSAGGNDARITFTPTITDFYVLFPTSAATSESGAYTISIQ